MCTLYVHMYLKRVNIQHRDIYPKSTSICTLFMFLIRRNNRKFIWCTVLFCRLQPAYNVLYCSAVYSLYTMYCTVLPPTACKQCTVLFCRLQSVYNVLSCSAVYSLYTMYCTVLPSKSIYNINTVQFALALLS